MCTTDELKDELGLLRAWQLSKMSCSQLSNEHERLQLSVFKQVAKISHEYKAMLLNYANLVAEFQTKNCARNNPNSVGGCEHCEKLKRFQ